MPFEEVVPEYTVEQIRQRLSDPTGASISCLVARETLPLVEAMLRQRGRSWHVTPFDDARVDIDVYPANS